MLAGVQMLEGVQILEGVQVLLLSSRLPRLLLPSLTLLPSNFLPKMSVELEVSHLRTLFFVLSSLLNPNGCSLPLTPGVQVLVSADSPLALVLHQNCSVVSITRFFSRALSQHLKTSQLISSTNCFFDLLLILFVK